MSIPVSIDPLGTLGESSYIPPGWHRVDFFIPTVGKSFHIDTESRPLIDDVVVLRYRCTDAMILYNMLTYRDSHTTDSSSRLGWQFNESGLSSRNFSSAAPKSLPRREDIMNEVAFDREGVLVDGVRYHTQPRDKFDDYTHDILLCPANVAFYGAELQRDGRLASKLVPYVNGDGCGLADTVNKRFYEA